MSYDIQWTKESEVTFNQNIEYLLNSWDLININKFLTRVDEVVNSLKHNPKLYPVYSLNNKIRKCVINKHITLYYTIISKSRIDLISFWNTHQDPENLKL